MFDCLTHKKEDVGGLFGGGGGGGGGDAGAEAAAAQERANALAIEETRRQFDITQGNIQPFITAGQKQLKNLQRGTTPGALDRRLGRIFSGENFQNLQEERTRALQGQLSAGGLTRSGTALEEAANIPTDLGFQIEQLLTGRRESLAGIGQSGAVNLGSLGAQSAGNISSLLQSSGQAQSSGILADQQASAASQQQSAQNILTVGGGIASAFADPIKKAASAIGSFFFSDPSLKENIEQIGEARDLKLYQWDWIEKTNGTMIEGCGTIGFMADEVKEKYPQHVYDFSGFMVIDYPALFDELEEAA